MVGEEDEAGACAPCRFLLHPTVGQLFDSVTFIPLYNVERLVYALYKVSQGVNEPGLGGHKGHGGALPAWDDEAVTDRQLLGRPHFDEGKSSGLETRVGGAEVRARSPEEGDVLEEASLEGKDADRDARHDGVFDFLLLPMSESLR